MSSVRFEPRSGLRGAALLGAVAIAASVLALSEPDVRAARSRVDDAEVVLRSDEVAFASAARLRSERDRLSAEFAHSFAVDPQADVLRRLASALRRHGVAFSSTANASTVPVKSPGAAAAEFEDVNLSLELRGSYRGVLMVVDELSRDCELARVDGASLHRSGSELDAHVTLALLRPLRLRASRAATSPGG
jgi:hypothetical protein